MSPKYIKFILKQKKTFKITILKYFKYITHYTNYVYVDYNTLICLNIIYKNHKLCVINNNYALCNKYD